MLGAESNLLVPVIGVIQIIFRKVYVFATHGIFSGCAKNILKEFPNMEKVMI